MKSINPFGKKAREAEALRQQQEAFRVADSIRVANEAQAEAERLRQASLAAEAQKEAEAMSGYHVIVGSFLTPAYADSWLEHIKGFGYDATVIETDDGRWQLISAQSFSDLHAAWNAIDRIQNNINSEAWVYRKQ
jgi:cell division protein FtsN